MKTTGTDLVNPTGVKTNTKNSVKNKPAKYPSQKAKQKSKSRSQSKSRYRSHSKIRKARGFIVGCVQSLPKNQFSRLESKTRIQRKLREQGKKVKAFVSQHKTPKSYDGFEMLKAKPIGRHITNQSGKSKASSKNRKQKNIGNKKAEWRVYGHHENQNHL